MHFNRLGVNQNGDIGHNVAEQNKSYLLFWLLMGLKHICNWLCSLAPGSNTSNHTPGTREPSCMSINTNR